MAEENNDNNKMSISDILGGGKMFPMDKLADMLRASFGRIFQSHFDRKDVDTKAYEIEKVAEAQARAIVKLAEGYKEASQITAGIGYKDDRVTIEAPKELPASPRTIDISEPPLEQRAIEVKNYREAQKELNVESVTAIAAEQLKDEDPVTDEPVNRDWTTRFFNIVEDVSDEEMQTLWGRILAGEIKKPKSFSLRTLELLRNLTQEEARIFTEVANLTITRHKDTFIFKGEDWLNKGPIAYSYIAEMKELGILNTGDFMAYTVEKKRQDTSVVFYLGKTAVIAERNVDAPEFLMPAYYFTKSGKELLQLINQNPPLEYLQDVAAILKKNQSTVQYGEIAKQEGQNLYFKSLKNL